MEIQNRLTVVDQNLNKINSCDLLNKFNSLVERAESTFGLESIAEHKGIYFEKYGKVFPDDNNYHERINYFLDQLIFETPNSSSPIYESVIDDEGIHGFLHSIFKIRKLKTNYMEVIDLFSNQSFDIDITNYKNLLLIAEKDDIFQGFLYFNKNNDQLIPSQGILFHPKKCKKLLKKFIKNAKNKDSYDKQEILSSLAKYQIKYRRMRHLKAQDIYKQLDLTL